MEGNDFYFLNNKTKTTPIENDYRISNNVLGLGINGKVVQCFSIKTGQKFALKVIFDRCIFLICCTTTSKWLVSFLIFLFWLLQVLVDCQKARREIDLHWRASGCINIVNIIDVYENLYMEQKCLLVIMEWQVIFDTIIIKK